MLENLGAEMLEGRTTRAEFETKQGCRQSGGCEAQSLRKGSWQQRGTVVPMDRGARRPGQYSEVSACQSWAPAPPTCSGPPAEQGDLVPARDLSLWRDMSETNTS